MLDKETIRFAHLSLQGENVARAAGKVNPVMGDGGSRTDIGAATLGSSTTCPLGRGMGKGGDRSGQNTASLG